MKSLVDLSLDFYVAHRSLVWIYTGYIHDFYERTDCRVYTAISANPKVLENLIDMFLCACVSACVWRARVRAIVEGYGLSVFVSSYMMEHYQGDLLRGEKTF